MGNFIITLLFGWAGIHKFMDKKVGIGILYFLTFGLFGFGWFVDIIKAAIEIKKTPKDKTLKIAVVGEYYKKSQIASLMSGNRLYNIPDADFITKVDECKRIYKYKYRRTEAQLVPEPNNPHDSNAIKVLVDDIHVGYIPANQCIEIKKILKQIKTVKAHMYGGNYKYHADNEVFKSEDDFSIELYITL